MEGKYKYIAIVLLALAIIAGALALSKSKREQTQQKNVDKAVEQINGTKKDAPKGELISGFPSDLVMENSPSIQSSYSVQYDANTKQYTATYELTKPIPEVYNSYLDYLGKNKYRIVNKNSTAAVSNIYATSDLADINVVLSKDLSTGKNIAVVTYLKK